MYVYCNICLKILVIMKIVDCLLTISLNLCKIRHCVSNDIDTTQGARLNFESKENRNFEKDLDTIIVKKFQHKNAIKMKIV